MASPVSVAATSEIEASHSPPPKSHLSLQDDNDIDDSRLADAGADDPSDKNSRSKKSKDKEKDKDKDALHIGKIRHLKKEDGEPLWRVDIQYDFLRAVFDDDRKVFLNSYDPEGIGYQTFADLYIDTMSRSTKTSKVLRDKLLSDREAAKGMAMVCLLVNVGRMNTTLNFFPEMRAQLRTYHAIPSLQAHEEHQHQYKQLQDAPRLKSILKGGAEDRAEPVNLELIKDQDSPRTNPVNLIFVMCYSAPKVAELHFPRNLEFHDLVMKTKYSSASRARAFLWLMWFYLESDFTEEGCDENPFGPGVDYDLGVANQGIPALELLSEEAQKLENVDPEEELEFGRDKQKTRAKILELDQAYLNDRENRRVKRMPYADEGPAILPRIRPSKHESDMDSTRSTPPPKGGIGRTGASSSNRRVAPLKYQIFEGSSPARQPEGIPSRKPRPPTAHQLAVERNRHERVEYILEHGLRRHHHGSRKQRRQDGAVFRAYKRVRLEEDSLMDSDSDSAPVDNLDPSPSQPFRERGIGGLQLLEEEEDDYGEEVSTYGAALRRSTRRLSRWFGRDPELGVVPPVKRRKPTTEDVDEGNQDGDDGSIRINGADNGDVTLGDVTMDDVDFDQTAMADDEGRADDDMDDPDKTEVLGDSDVD